MPKENTHIFFAYNLLQEFEDSETRQAISRHISTYLLGAISPDTFYYSRHATISDYLHGKDGNPTNALTLEMIERARDEMDLVFVLGYLTHCALDIVFHPVIYYLSGNYYDKDPAKRDQAVYTHRHLETCLDVQLDNHLRIHEVLRPSDIEGLVFEEIISKNFAVVTPDIRLALKKQLLYNRSFSSDTAFGLVRCLYSLGILKDAKILGLFYGNLKIEPDRLNTGIVYKDLITGEERVSSLKKLMAAACETADTMLQQAHLYAQGSTSKKALLQVISGASLDTGKVSVPVNDIRYTQDAR